MLTACRSGEVRGARWDEVDDVAATWTVPPERMKAGLEHRVPLSERAVAVLDEAREISDQSGVVFPSPTGRVLTDVAREVCELALAHVNSDRVEAAYRRSDLFERRRDLMQAWSEYVDCT